MKKLWLVMLVVLAVFVAGCRITNRQPTYEKEQNKQTRQMMNEAFRQIGMPNIRNFQQRKLLKLILELADRGDLIAYAYTYDWAQGKFRYVGRCLGFGVPFSAQYTNPMQIVDDPYGDLDAGGKVIPQPDPNGLYMPTTSSATWVILIDESGSFNLVYMEPHLTVSQKPLPTRVVLGYPTDFWEKYNSGKYNLTRKQIREGLQSLKTH